MVTGWKHSGFSVHNKARIKTDDAEGRKQLACYMIRNPFSLEKMTYKTKQGVVVYRSKLHATLKRNYQLMPGAEWLKLLIRHIPDKGEHLVRYYGWYSSRCRGERRRMLEASMVEERRQARIAVEEQPDPAFANAVRSAWARLIRKVYEVDPLICPHCGGVMRFLAVIEEAPVIERILRHIKAWNPRPPLRAPPVDDDWPENSQILLTYHPVPDIA
jgi:hypothetical protein